MITFKCPSCQSDLQTIKCPDMEYLQCVKCRGIYLEKNELNILATGESGDIEFCSIDTDPHNDKYPARICIHCNNQMRKINLLEFSNIIFDYCETCDGFFLDNGELDEMNDYLKSISPSGSSEEFRGTINDILIRADIQSSFELGVTGGLPIESISTQNFLIISAYYNNPLNIDLSITQNTILHRLLKVISKRYYNVCITGNHQFDSHFSIIAKDEDILKKYFNSETTSMIMDFIKTSPHVYSLMGKISFLDDRIIYKEGPYSDIPSYKDDYRFNNMFNNMSNIAKTLK